MGDECAHTVRDASSTSFRSPGIVRVQISIFFSGVIKMHKINFATDSFTLESGGRGGRTWFCSVFDSGLMFCKRRRRRRRCLLLICTSYRNLYLDATDPSVWQFVSGCACMTYVLHKQLYILTLREHTVFSECQTSRSGVSRDRLNYRGFGIVCGNL